MRDRHRHGHVPFVRDADGHVLQPERGRSGRRPRVEANLRCSCRVGQDSDLAPADPADAQPKHLADRLLGGPAPGDPLGPRPAVARLALGQDPLAESIRKATQRGDDAVDVDQVDADIR